MASLSKLDTQEKRIGFVVLAFGIIILVIGLLSNGNIDDFDDLIHAMFWSKSYHSKYEIVVFLGCWVTAIGAFTLFGYEQALLPLIKWVKNGKVFSEENDDNKNILYFKDAESAFEYCNKYMDYKLKEGEVLTCMVDELSTAKDGSLIASVRLPCTSKNQKALAIFMGRNIEKCQLSVGSLCGVYIGPFVKEYGMNVLMLTHIYSPELNLEKGWKVRELL